jgi:hypothetical protein
MKFHKIALIYNDVAHESIIKDECGPRFCKSLERVPCSERQDSQRRKPAKFCYYEIFWRSPCLELLTVDICVTSWLCASTCLLTAPDSFQFLWGHSCSLPCWPCRHPTHAPWLVFEPNKKKAFTIHLLHSLQCWSSPAAHPGDFLVFTTVPPSDTLCGTGAVP